MMIRKYLVCWLEICFWDEDYAFFGADDDIRWEGEAGSGRYRIPLKWWEDEYSRLNTDGVEKDVFEEGYAGNPQKLPTETGSDPVDKTLGCCKIEV